MCLNCSVLTEVFVKLLCAILLIHLSSLTMSSILPVGTLLRPRLELSGTQEDWKGKGEPCWHSF